VENRIYQARVSTGAKSRVSTGANQNKQRKETKSVYEEINSYKSLNETLFHSTETVDWTKRPVKKPFSFFQAEDQVFSAYINHRGGAAFLSGGPRLKQI